MNEESGEREFGWSKALLTPKLITQLDKLARRHGGVFLHTSVPAQKIFQYEHRFVFDPPITVAEQNAILAEASQIPGLPPGMYSVER